SDQTGCASGPSSIFTWPPEVALAFQPLDFSIETTTRNSTVDFIGEHQWIPGLDAAEALNSIIIGESTWRQLVGEDKANNLTATTWFYNVGTLATKDDGEVLRRLNSQLTTFMNTSIVLDWSTAHEEVERNGGLIYGTPGLLTLQFVVASLAAVASAFVFLTLVLTQRRKELAILQAIGASPNQVMRLVLFEILSIVIFSMVLGSMLGVGISYAFNGFFEIFGFIFQLFGGNSTPIDRDLLFPWFRLTAVYVIVLATVITALLLTTRQALKSDLAVTLKGE
ncbi:MAG TPA: FtsX-like permease family protein, partial [Candidatus Poseidoniales archaeon]|nr:FtsX-like permease family protein [Candidatus Poseidoniales archaeon]